MSRFGIQSMETINGNIENLTPIHTKRSKQSIWSQFQLFCEEKSYILGPDTAEEVLVTLLKDWGANMRKKNGSEYKEAVVKTMWNVTAKLLKEKYYNEYNRKIDPFTDISFKPARDARDAARKMLQKNPEKRTASAVAFNHKQYLQMVQIWDENTPEGLQKRFFHIVSYELAWRGGEAVNCLVDFFKEDGLNRVEYNPIFSKTAQGGAHVFVNISINAMNVLFVYHYD